MKFSEVGLLGVWKKTGSSSPVMHSPSVRDHRSLELDKQLSQVYKDKTYQNQNMYII